jgi:NTP pyrophosphatase (non-canonical NTP hydrolase)
MSYREQVLDLIRDERERQDRKWGADRNLHILEWLAILAEEFGEISEQVVELHAGAGDLEALKKELVQTAAVAVSWLEARERSANASL